MSFEINKKPLSVPEGDEHALILAGSSLQAASASFVIENLSEGANEFKAVYRTNANKACEFQNRSIWAIPLP
jgi:hypothetical protein